MYQKYQTDALVLSSRELGEADKMYALFTRDFGLVRARASAVRREASRMRYALQNYALVHVSLVRGKRGWRIAGARSEGAALGLGAFARAAELVTRLVPGEEKNDYLYESLLGAHQALMQGCGGPTSRGGRTSAISTIEIVCVARVLYALGYISAEALQTALFTHADFQSDDIREAESLRPKLLASINHALAETQLITR